ncbi:7-cyano-7-deazaguanine synthase [Actinomycetospora flava]|uniref:7-cyano-7-deazaguanine synthase n=1 Tax=Actinomycetospora flava TaxID=3129232 RepID=A0ABU8M261_9PSEU
MTAGAGKLASTHALVLLSGGIDSFVALTLLPSSWDREALFVDYGQPAAALERSASRAIAHETGVRWREVVASISEVPMRGEIVGRNALLFAIAHAAISGNQGSTLLVAGLHSGVPYSDCSPEFVEQSQRLLDIQSAGQVQISCPLLAWTKSDIIDYALGSSVDLSLTYSCEAGDADGCGNCESCLDRKRIDVRS